MLEDEIYNENQLDDPDDLERIIEGEDNIERNNLNISGNESEGGNEGDNQNDDEEKKKTVPKIKRVVNPLPKLNADRLKGPRGIGILESFFQNVKLKGKGHEKEDLDVVMKHLEHWAHRLYPRFKFDDCLEKIEKLGNKRPIQNYLNRIRLGMEEEAVSTTEDPEEPPLSPPMADPFDELIGSRPSQPPSQPNVTLNSEQRERMLRNRMIAEERRMARMKAQQEKQRIQNEIQETNENLYVEISHAESDNTFENMCTDEVSIRKTNIPSSEDISLENTKSYINDESTNVLHETDQQSSQISSDDSVTASRPSNDIEDSIIAVQRERMLQNKRKAEELIMAKKRAKLENISNEVTNKNNEQVITETVSICNQSNNISEQNYINHEQIEFVEIEAKVEKMNENNKITLQDEPDTRSDLTNNKTQVISVNESTYNEQKLDQETENESYKNMKETIDKEETGGINSEENYINIESRKEFDTSSTSKEQRLYQEMENENCKNVKEVIDLNNKEKEGINSEVIYTNIENAEEFDINSTSKEEKLYQETENENCENIKEAIGLNNKENEGINFKENYTNIENTEDFDTIGTSEEQKL